jgi:pyruvate carboxylase
MTSNSFSKQDVIRRADQLDFPSSVVEFFQGYLGQPVGGFPEPLRSNIIRNKPRIDGRPGATMAPLDFKKIKAELRSRFGKHITDADVTSYVMYPKVCGALHSRDAYSEDMLTPSGLRRIPGVP